MPGIADHGLGFYVVRDGQTGTEALEIAVGQTARSELHLVFDDGRFGHFRLCVWDWPASASLFSP